MIISLSQIETFRACDIVHLIKRTYASKIKLLPDPPPCLDEYAYPNLYVLVSIRSRLRILF